MSSPSSSSQEMLADPLSQIGRYGTISLLKRSDPETAITAFGVDTEVLTFGRDPTCSVRLYYPDVGLVHCKIIFEEHKAFLVVLGKSGLLIDGCKVFPNVSSNESSTTIPLINNSEFEIHSKRFRFTYPPKDIRPALYATPHKKKRALRLSMIHSAYVFSPRPSKDPRENLRILQSPLKNAFRPPTLNGQPASPLSHLRNPFDDSDKETDEIVLVSGDHPRVVEEDRDLVILEDIEVVPEVNPTGSRIHSPTPRKFPVSAQTPTQNHQQQQPEVQPTPPQTPQRPRSRGSTNPLHRAVLIRSAQRAVIRAEQAREEEEEEMEVLGTVVSGAVDTSDTSGSVEEDEEDEDQSMEGSDDEERQQQKPLWRKSLERIWPFGSSSDPAPEESELPDEERTEEENDSDETESEKSDQEREDRDEIQSLPVVSARASAQPLATPIRRPLGRFMTPQASTSAVNSSDTATAAKVPQPAMGRYSLSGKAGEAQRLVFQQPWKVKDLVVPAKTEAEQQQQLQMRTPRRKVIQSPVRQRTVVDEETRKAISERRRSVLREPDPFWAGNVPGMAATPRRSPTKPEMTTATSNVGSRMSASPTRGLGGYGQFQAKGAFAPATSSTFTPRNKVSLGVGPSMALEDTREDNAEDDEVEQEEVMDTRSLLERMKETVEAMKRRKSLGLTSPSKSPGGQEARDSRPEDTPTSSNPSIHVVAVMDVDHLEQDEQENDENRQPPIIVEDNKEEEPFLLIQPPPTLLHTLRPPSPVNQSHIIIDPPRTRRSKNVLVSDTPASQVDALEVPRLRGRNHRGHSATPETNNKPRSKTNEVEAPPKSAETPIVAIVGTKRGRLATKGSTAAASAPKSGGRKPKAVEVERPETPVEVDEETEKSLPTRRGTSRTPIATTITKAATATTSKTRRGTRTNTQPLVGNDDDPLDMLDQTDEVLPLAPTAAVVKKKRTPAKRLVKKEAGDEGVPLHPIDDDAAIDTTPIAATKSSGEGSQQTRTRSTREKSAVSAVAATSMATTGTRARGSSKKNQAPSAVLGSGDERIVDDKENTPGRESMEGTQNTGDGGEENLKGKKLVATRSSRIKKVTGDPSVVDSGRPSGTRSGRKAAVKVEQEEKSEDEATPAVQATGRIMRTRTTRTK